jgi:hypothetical protein
MFFWPGHQVLVSFRNCRRHFKHKNVVFVKMRYYWISPILPAVCRITLSPDRLHLGQKEKRFYIRSTSKKRQHLELSCEQ